VLEKGVYGILLKTDRPGDGKVRCRAPQIPGTGNVGLVPFRVTKIHPVGMGDRVCVDTCSMLSDGEGMLMGNTSSAMLLVHAETLENPYVAPARSGSMPGQSMPTSSCRTGRPRTYRTWPSAARYS
jgi:3-dehydroquinate synthase II